MTVNLLLQSGLVGINLAAIYALMALGLTLMFGILGIVNMAHGVLYMVGAYGMYYLYHLLGLNFYLAMLATIITLGLIGLLMERIFYRPVGGQFAPFIAITLGLLILFEAGGYLVFGYEPRGVTAPVAGVSTILGVGMSNYRLVVILIAAILVGGLYYLIHRTKTGRNMRAVEEDRIAAALQGVNADRTNAITFALGVALAAAAGALIAPLYAIIPPMGGMPLLKAFMVIVLGGMGSIPGVILGAIAIGLADSLLAATVGIELAYIFAWFIIIVLLIFRPRGLLGAY
ncbi:branched-chain amino acid ABC transporter permease [Chloroflexota bacterium]